MKICINPDATASYLHVETYLLEKVWSNNLCNFTALLSYNSPTCSVECQDGASGLKGISTSFIRQVTCLLCSSLIL